MPFEVFRRHQKKLIAIFGLLAMFGFVISDSVPRMLNSSGQGRDQEVANLYGRTIYQSDLGELAAQRNRANAFVGDLVYRMSRGQRPVIAPFGGLKTRDLVDAMILQHEADKLGIPGGPELGRDFLKKITMNQMTRDLFEDLASRFSNTVSGEQLLADIGSQVRLENVRRLLGSPLVTPYDVFTAYRDQTERVSAKAIEIPVDRFLAKVPEPSQSEIQQFYDRYKDVLPDSTRDTPGFKVPRQIQVEFLSVDGNALAKKIRDSLSEAELRSYYENRKSEFEVSSDELPKDLFAGSPELTPPVILPFDDVRAGLATSLADDRAQTEILDKFAKIKDEEMIPFADKYLSALEDFEEARKRGGKGEFVPPTPKELKEVAQREGLQHETTPLLSEDKATRYGQISIAEVGLNRSVGGRKFSDEIFDSKTGLFEPVELSDVIGTRYLARKIKDNPPYVPPLEQVRSEVVQAWKIAQARPLAEKAAGDLAAEIKKQGGAIKDQSVQGYRVVDIHPITRKRFDILPGQFMDFGPPVETRIPEVPDAGDSFRDAFFHLEKGSTAVVPNQPKTIWYVLTLEKRDPATLASLYAPNGDEFRFKSITRDQASRTLDDQWMGQLRGEAGLKPGWIPPDEAKDEKTSRL